MYGRLCFSYPKKCIENNRLKYKIKETHVTSHHDTTVPHRALFLLFKERKARPAYEKIFSDFNNDIRDDNALSQSDKIQRYKDMLRKNDYKIIETTETSVTGEKKIFSMSLFAMSVGLYYVGAVVYLLYFYTMQSPHRVVFDTEGGK